MLLFYKTNKYFYYAAVLHAMMPLMFLNVRK